MPPRNPKVRPRTKIVRDRQAFRVLHKTYGIEQLCRWYEEDCRSPPKAGRRPFKWFMALSEPVRAKDRMTNADWQRNVRTNPPRRKARKI